MNRKGIGAIFAWIFILIAGALIITLFVVLAQGQAASAKESLSLRALQNVNTILSTQQTAGGVQADVPIPESDIRMMCSVFIEGGSVALLDQLEIGGQAQGLDGRLITGRDMHAEKLLLFSKTWKAPFEAADILYLSNPDELLVYEADSQRMRDSFAAMIPANIASERAGSQDASRYENLRLVYITESTDYDDLSSLAVNTEGALLMHVRPDNPDDIAASGTVTYYTENNQEPANEYHYVGEAMLFAYLWQGDEMRANCLQHKLAQTLRVQLKLQEERRENLEEAYGTSACQAKLSGQALGTLNSAIDGPNTDFDSQRIGAAGNTLYSFDGLADAASDLRDANERLLRGDRCATFY